MNRCSENRSQFQYLNSLKLSRLCMRAASYSIGGRVGPSPAHLLGPRLLILPAHVAQHSAAVVRVHLAIVGKIAIPDVVGVERKGRRRMLIGELAVARWTQALDELTVEAAVAVLTAVGPCETGRRRTT